MTHKGKALVTGLWLAGVGVAGAGQEIILDSVEQVTPPGATGKEQTLIIRRDRYGNEQRLSIGGGAIVGGAPRPCSKVRPVTRMDCRGHDLSGVDWEGARLAGGLFQGANLTAARLRNADLTNASLDGARLGRADLRGAQLVNCDLPGADLAEARLAGADLTNCDLMEASLRGADLSGARLVNLDLDDADLSDATWSDGRRCAPGSRGRCRPR